MPSRRDFLRLAGAGGSAAGLAALLAACGGDDEPGGAAPAGSLQALKADATQLSLLGAQSQLPVGTGLYTFGLATPDNRLVTGGAPEVWVALNDTGRAAGPFPTRWFELEAYEETKDTSPRSPLRGFYGAEVEFPEAGNWMVAATTEVDGGRAVGSGGVPVAAEVPAAVGSKAKALSTPVATTAAGRKKICTREPACPLHEVSLDDALKEGRPTVVNFGTPLLCTSRICGPVVDEQMVVADKLGDRASFVHVEIYPSRDTSKPVPALTEYGFTTEPWILVVDRAGVIRARYEGPVTAAQIEDALRPLLA
ncbi:MAG TPA: thioredoxin family protein [Actinomycetota bacterium]|nr:thioredoxin family protein [Actinomycetota bacterium]